MAEAVQLLAGPPLVRMVHTKHGAQVNCAVISYGSAKDRKKVVKAMAEHVDKLVNEEWGHLVLLCALSTVDDTTLLRKSLVPELQVSCQLLLSWPCKPSKLLLAYFVCQQSTACHLCNAFSVPVAAFLALLYDDTHVDGRTDLMMSVNCTASLTGCA